MRSLILGENCHNRRHFPGYDIPRGCNELFARDPKLSIEALQTQRASLRSLTYCTAVSQYGGRTVFKTAKPVDGGFADFLALESVRLIGTCPLFEQAVMSMQSPPNLKSLFLRTGRPFQFDYKSLENRTGLDLTDIPFLRAPSVSITPTLESLEIVYHDNYALAIHLSARNGPERAIIREAGKAVSKSNITLRVHTSVSEQGRSYFPPFLYGEEEPGLELVFDGKAFVGRFSELDAPVEKLMKNT